MMTIVEIRKELRNLSNEIRALEADRMNFIFEHNDVILDAICAMMDWDIENVTACHMNFTNNRINVGIIYAVDNAYYQFRVGYQEIVLTAREENI